MVMIVPMVVEIWLEAARCTIAEVAMVWLWYVVGVELTKKWQEGGMQMGYAKYFSSRPGIVLLNSIWDEN
jgi:hypothetical protein